MAPPLKRRQPGSSGSSSSTWLFLWGAGLALLVAAMAGVATVPLKPEVAVGEDEYKPPVPLDEITEYHLRMMPFPDLFRFFHTLSAPADSLDGEYLAEMLDSGSLLANLLAWAGFSPLYPGRWIGKAFVGGGAGHGYNVFVYFNAKVDRRFKMATSFANSVWDGKPSFELQYHGQEHILGRARMRDEVREVRPGLYLGMGTFGLTEAKRREPLPFLLRGPFALAQPERVSEKLLQ